MWDTVSPPPASVRLYLTHSNVTPEGHRSRTWPVLPIPTPLVVRGPSYEPTPRQGRHDSRTVLPLPPIEIPDVRTGHQPPEYGESVVSGSPRSMGQDGQCRLRILDTTVKHGSDVESGLDILGVRPSCGSETTLRTGRVLDFRHKRRSWPSTSGTVWLKSQDHRLRMEDEYGIKTFVVGLKGIKGPGRGNQGSCHVSDKIRS